MTPVNVATIEDIERRVSRLIETAESAATRVRETMPGTITNRLAHDALTRALDQLRDVRAELENAQFQPRERYFPSRVLGA